MLTNEQEIFNNMMMDFEGSLNLHTIEQDTIDDSVQEYDGVSSASNNADRGKGTRRRGTLDETFTFNDTKKAVESSLPSLTEPFLATTDVMLVEPNDGDSVMSAKLINKLMNRQYSKMANNIEFIETLAKKLQVEGTVFAKVGWQDNRPTVEIVPSSSIYLDPTAKRMEDLNFLCETTKTSIGSILSNPDWYGEHTMDSLSPLVASTSDDNYEESGYGNDDGFNFEDRTRTLVDVVTYYGMYDIKGKGQVEPVVGIWSDNVLLNLTESPFPESFNGIPFEAGVYIRRSGSIYGASTASLTNDTSLVRNAIMRNILKVVAKGGQGQKGVSKGALDPVNFRRFTNGEDYQYNKGDFQVIEGEFNDVPQHITNVMEQMKVEQEELLGMGRLNSGLDPRALNSGTSATAAQLVNNNSEKRLLQTTRHISEMLERVFNKWLALNQELLQDGVVNIGGQYIPVGAEQLQGDFDLEITVGITGKTNERIQNLNLMMGKMVESGREIPAAMLATMADLLNMPKIAEEFANEAIAQEQGPSEQEQFQMQQEQQQQEQMQQAGIQLEFQEKQSVVAKNNAKAELDNAKSMEVFVDASNKSYGL